MHLLGQLVVCPPDLGHVGFSRHAEDLVEVSPETTLNFVNVLIGNNYRSITILQKLNASVVRTLVLNALTVIMTCVK